MYVNWSMVILRCEPMQYRGPYNIGILIPFGSPLVNYYKDRPILTFCIIVKCKIRKIICYTVQLSDSGCKNKCYVMLCYVM